MYIENGSFTDSASTSWTATVNYADGSGDQQLTLSAKNFSLSHMYLNEGLYTIVVYVTDNQGATGMKTTTVTVNNAPFTLSAITASSTSSPINSSITAAASFRDPGVFDIHTAYWNWGDGIVTVSYLKESNGSGSVSDSDTYTNAGIYVLSLTVTDDANVSVTWQSFNM